MTKHNYPLTADQSHELFAYCRKERAFKNGEITRDELTSYRFTLSHPVQDAILRSSKISFEIIE